MQEKSQHDWKIVDWDLTDKNYSSNVSAQLSSGAIGLNILPGPYSVDTGQLLNQDLISSIQLIK